MLDCNWSENYSWNYAEYRALSLDLSIRIRFSTTGNSKMTFIFSPNQPKRGFSVLDCDWSKNYSWNYAEYRALSPDLSIRIRFSTTGTREWLSFLAQINQKVGFLCLTVIGRDRKVGLIYVVVKNGRIFYHKYSQIIVNFTKCLQNRLKYCQISPIFPQYQQILT